jgi:hypothetical protein
MIPKILIKFFVCIYKDQIVVSRIVKETGEVDEMQSESVENFEEPCERFSRCYRYRYLEEAMFRIYENMQVLRKHKDIFSYGGYKIEICDPCRDSSHTYAKLVDLFESAEEDFDLLKTNDTK